MKFSKKILGSLALVCSLVVSANAAGEKVTWKLATSWNAEFPPFTDSVANMAKMVETMSGGDFVIKVDAVNKHKSAFGIMDMVKLGQYEMGHTASYYYKGKMYL